MKEERKNILFGNIIVEEYKGKKTIQTTLKDVVFKEHSTFYKGFKILKVLEYKIVGKTNINKSYSKVKGSDELRNKITGAYE